MTSHKVGGLRNVTTCDKDGGGVKKIMKFVWRNLWMAPYQSIGDLTLEYQKWDVIFPTNIMAPFTSHGPCLAVIGLHNVNCLHKYQSRYIGLFCRLKDILMNKSYYASLLLLGSKLISDQTKPKLHCSTIKPVVTSPSEGSVLRRIFGPTKLKIKISQRIE